MGRLKRYLDILRGRFQKSLFCSKGSADAIPSKAIIYKSEMEFISRCILDYKDIETGGELFGFWTESGVPVVMYAIGPGSKANHQVTFFNQDTDYLNDLGMKIFRQYGLHHIGEWHSHHQLGLAQPSSHDTQTMISTIRRRGLRRFLCCIGNCNETTSMLNPFNFTDSTNYVRAQWEVQNVDSPFRATIDSELSGIVIQPRTQRPNYAGMSPSRLVKANYAEGYWLNKPENRAVLKQIIDFVTSIEPESSLMIDEKRNVHIVSDSNIGKGQVMHENISFPMGFPVTAPEYKVAINGKKRTTPEATWHYTGDILISFINYYKQFKP